MGLKLNPADWSVGGKTLSGAWDDFTGVSSTEAMNKTNVELATARNALEAEEAQKARDFSRSQASINREFQERMSNSAVQRRMQDLKQSGVNPILAGKFDAGTPSGGIGATAKGNMDKATAQRAPSGAEQINNAISTAQNVATLANTTANTAKKVQDVDIDKFDENFGKYAGDQFKNMMNNLNSVTDDIGAHLGGSAEQIRNTTKNLINDGKNTVKDGLKKYFKIDIFGDKSPTAPPNFYK